MDANLRIMGFCGVDDSVPPELLQLISETYPFVEWGVLFRSDLEGTPRYPTMNWVLRLVALKCSSGSLRLAGHLCADRCQAILSGDSTFVSYLFSLGFRRVQINATAANKVHFDPSEAQLCVTNIMRCMHDVPGLEFIVQCNEETEALWKPLVDAAPSNMSMLYDASCGTGVRVSSFPSPSLYPHIPCGYAGGIGPECIDDILSAVATATGPSGRQHPVWIDMESSLRATLLTAGDGAGSRDVFSVERCFRCILAGLHFGLRPSPRGSS